MIKTIFNWAVVILLLGMVNGCENKKVPLNKDEFTALLIDMHRVDGTLSANRSVNLGNPDLKNYTYYNDLFKRYGITRADFDSCMYYYSVQTVLFSKMYDVIIDSLNRQVTVVDKILNELKSKDSINYFPVLDTIRLDSVFRVNIDTIVPGQYKFNTTIRFDSMSDNRNRRIASYFLSADGKDTLKVRDVIVSVDTVVRNYNWSQYVDSVYSRLVITYLEIVPVEERPKIYERGKLVKPARKKKEINLKDFGGQSWDNQLFRPYISRDTEQRLKQGLHRR